MANLLDIVDVVISRSASTPSRRGFGVAMIVAYHNAWLDRVRSYSSPSAMLEDGFTTDDAAYQAAVALMSQNPRPKRFKVGRRAGAPTQTHDYTPTITAEGHVYSGSIGGEAWAYVVPEDATVNSVIVGIAAAINALTVNVGATPNPAAPGATKLIVGAVDPGDWFAHEDLSTGLMIKDQTAEPGTTLATDLAAIKSADGDWFGLVVADAQSEPQINAIATWAESEERLYFAHTADTAVPTNSTTDIGSDLEASSFFNTALIYSRNGHGSFPDAALFGVLLPLDPGSAQAQYKALAGVPVDTLTDTQAAFLEAKNVTYYTSISGLNVTVGGKVAGGEWIDIMQSIYFLLARIRERVFGAIASPPKLPYTNAGIDVVVGAVKGVLNSASQPPQNILDPTAITVEAPTVDEIDVADRQNRILPDVIFDARLSGAIVKGRIIGTVRP